MGGCKGVMISRRANKSNMVIAQENAKKENKLWKQKYIKEFHRIDKSLVEGDP